MILSNVDLPHPEGPRIKKSSPAFTENEISDSTEVEAKLLETCEISRLPIG
jgi:hypothetical protein